MTEGFVTSSFRIPSPLIVDWKKKKQEQPETNELTTSSTIAYDSLSRQDQLHATPRNRTTAATLDKDVALQLDQALDKPRQRKESLNPTSTLSACINPLFEDEVSPGCRMYCNSPKSPLRKTPTPTLAKCSARMQQVQDQNIPFMNLMQNSNPAILLRTSLERMKTPPCIPGVRVALEPKTIAFLDKMLVMLEQVENDNGRLHSLFRFNYRR
jgi:hypothetical protein